jgi:adenine-specific DNA-methyltransferase
LKVICDEIWGFGNFINNIIWQKKFSPQNDAKYFSDNHDFIVCYAKSKTSWKRNLILRTQEQDARYKNLDNDQGEHGHQVILRLKLIQRIMIIQLLHHQAQL